LRLPLKLMHSTSKARVVLVTGASSGIGRAIAQVLAQKGYSVYGTSRKAKWGEAEHGVQLIPMDVTNESSVQTAIQTIVEQEGRIDVVINNAGLGMLGAVESVTNHEVKELFDTNVFGVLNVCRSVIPHMRAQHYGYIINITSIAGKMGLPFRGIYSSSKFAVEGFSESLSQELQQFGIRVCIIEPGDYRTAINQNRRVAQQIQDVYAQQSEETHRRVNDEVAKAQTPEAMGHLIHRIVNDSHPRLRYRSANLFQRFSLSLKRILPSRLFEKLVMKHYGMKSLDES
jgi:NAD(P)-dependent dehydrogenase (short-subunit alcohol dehydrogenase family)